jgi:hypothetical protein
VLEFDGRFGPETLLYESEGCCWRKIPRFEQENRRIGETMQSASSYAIKTNDCDFMLRISARVLMAIT